MPRPPFSPLRPRFTAPAGAARAAGAVASIVLVAMLATACRNAAQAAPPSAEAGSGATVVAVAAAPTASRAEVTVPASPSLPSAASEQASPASTPGESLAAVEARLDHMLRAASACTGDAECRSVAVGGKACGGPTGYRAYSSKGADPQEVEALARKDHDLAMAAERASGRVSNCLFLADPGARCMQGKCVTGGPNAPRGAGSR